MLKTDPLSALQQAYVQLKGQFIYGSNYTFLVLCEYKGDTFKAVYKPLHGERTLWDFPSGTLAGREVAAYLVSEALGWDLVPPTVYREKDVPLGPGSLQVFIEHNPEMHYFNFNLEQKAPLPRVMLFDYLINNADRKAGHLLINPEGKLYLIDHGLSFHVEDKLRTVVWDYAGEPIPPELCQDLEGFLSEFLPGAELWGRLEPYLQSDELIAIGRRGRMLLESGRFPLPPENRRAYPWPLV
jgi:hypothetical protein